MIGAGSKPWTTEDDAALVMYWGVISCADIGKKLGRSRHSCVGRAWRKGLRKLDPRTKYKTTRTKLQFARLKQMEEYRRNPPASEHMPERPPKAAKDPQCVAAAEALLMDAKRAEHRRQAMQRWR